MKSVIQLFGYLVILLIPACTNRDSVIEGTLPDDIYHGEVIYWVPFEGASSETVDSALTHKNRFRIVISRDNLNKMGIIRVKPLLRLNLQELLVFTEAGTIQVKLDSISSASGAPLNDVLQNWKERKHMYDREIYTLRRKLRTADVNDKTGIQEEIENISDAYHDDIFQIVLNNKDNDVGKFILSLHKSKFTHEQMSEIEQ